MCLEDHPPKKSVLISHFEDSWSADVTGSMTEKLFIKTSGRFKVALQTGKKFLFFLKIISRACLTYSFIKQQGSYAC